MELRGPTVVGGLGLFIVRKRAELLETCKISLH